MAAVVVVSFGMAACADEQGENTDGASGSGVALEAEGERAGPEADGEQAGSEGEGEHGGSEGEGEHGGSEGEGEHGGSEGEGGPNSSGEGEHGEGEEGEESGEYIGREDTWDATRRGARLVLSLDPASNAFVGTVENTTGQTLCAVRVEIHLSTGIELGPTERTDLPSGETTVVELSTEGEAFDTWTAHPEVSSCAGG